MKQRVDIHVEIDPSREKPRVVIQAAEAGDLVDALIEAIERCADGTYPSIAVESGGSLVMLDPRDIIRLHTENRRVVIHTESGQYETRSSLQDIEKRLDTDHFVRISRFEVIHLDKAVGFDFSVTGTIKVMFEDGSETYVARRYVSAIRDLLKRLRQS